jgi:hypothetical protein
MAEGTDTRRQSPCRREARNVPSATRSSCRWQATPVTAGQRGRCATVKPIDATGGELETASLAALAELKLGSDHDRTISP